MRLSWALGALLCCASQPLWAQTEIKKPADTRLAVLPVLVSGAQKLKASAVFNAVNDAAAQRPALRVMSIDDYFFHGGAELAAQALSCGEDTYCLAGKLSPFRAQMGLIVVVNTEIDPPFMSLTLVDTKTKKRAAEAFAEFSPDKLSEQILKETSKMLDQQGFVRTGKLQVNVEPSRAQVELKPKSQPDIGTHNLFSLYPGKYEVKAQLDGYDSAEQRVDIISGQTTEIQMSLVEQSSIFKSPWFWGVVAAVAAGGVTAAVVATQSESDCFCLLSADGEHCMVCRP